MMQTVTGVVKKNRVRTREPCRIGAQATPAGAARGPVGQPLVRLAERHDDHAILEVRCVCGQTTHVECRWKVPAPGDGPDTAAPDAGDPSDHSPKEVK